MSKGSKIGSGSLLMKLREARALVDECIAVLQDLPQRKHAATGGQRSQPKDTHARRELDFDQPLRPFIKNHGKGMSGPKKFTLLLARLANGDATKGIALKELEKQWNKMTAKSLMGMEFNRFYAGAAKNNDWVESGKQGLYNLRPSWRDILR